MCLSEAQVIPLFILAIEDDEERENCALLYSRYEKYLFGIAYKITQNFEDAEDALNEAFAALIRSGTLLKADDPRVKAQLVTTVRNEAIDIYNSNKRHLFEELDENLAEKRSEYAPDILIDLKNCLLKLSEDQTELLELYYYRGYTTQEIAEIKKMKQDTVQKKLKRSREQIKKMLSGR